MMSGRCHLIRAAPQPSDDDHRVVSFRPRRAEADGKARRREPIHDRDPNISLAEDLAKYERDDHDDDYRHRMIMNGVAVVVIVALIAIGIWLAANINDQGHASSAVNFGAALDSGGHRISAAAR